MVERPERHVLRAVNIEKRFGHQHVLRSVTLELRPGEVLALIGDNGAGKSTLTKCLCGVYQPDAGHLEVDGAEITFASIRDAEAAGVGVVHQDLALAPDLSILENIFLGHELVLPGLLGRLGFLARRRMGAEAERMLAQLGVRVPAIGRSVLTLSGGQRQAVAIARAAMWARSVVMMDEPTAALGVRQSEIVCDLIRDTAQRGLSVLVISHDLPRILAVADRVVVLCRGTVALDACAGDVTIPDLVAAMVGYVAEAS